MSVSGGFKSKIKLRRGFIALVLFFIVGGVILGLNISDKKDVSAQGTAGSGGGNTACGTYKMPCETWGMGWEEHDLTTINGMNMSLGALTGSWTNSGGGYFDSVVVSALPAAHHNGGPTYANPVTKCREVGATKAWVFIVYNGDGAADYNSRRWIFNQWDFTDGVTHPVGYDNSWGGYVHTEFQKVAALQPLPVSWGNIGWFCSNPARSCPQSLPSEWANAGYRFVSGREGARIPEGQSDRWCYEPNNKKCPASLPNASEWRTVRRGGRPDGWEIPNSANYTTAQINQECFVKACPTDSPRTSGFTIGNRGNDLHLVTSGNSSTWAWNAAMPEMETTCYTLRCNEGTHRGKNSAPATATGNGANSANAYPLRNGCNKRPCPADSAKPSGLYDDRTPAASYDIRTCYASPTSGNHNPSQTGSEEKDTFGLNAYPQVQFLGGGILSAGQVKGQRFTTKTTNRVFGSWAEYAIVAGGSVTSFASGGAFGYNGGFEGATSVDSAHKSTSNGNSWTFNSGGYSPISSRNKQGGGLVVDNAASASACRFSKMTIYNQNCESGQVGRNGTEADITGSKVSASNAQVSELRGLFVPTNTTTANDVANVSTRSGYDKDNPAFKLTSGSITINDAVTLGSGDFRVYATTGTVVINENIIIKDDISYTPDTVPQVLIFANDIRIHPKVTRVDAWLIATNSVNTCFRATASVMPLCDANQLVINAPVFTQTLTLSRTYTGLKTGTAADGVTKDMGAREAKNCNGAETVVIDENGVDRKITRTMTVSYNLTDPYSFNTPTASPHKSPAQTIQSYRRNKNLSSVSGVVDSNSTSFSTPVPSPDPNRHATHTIPVCNVAEPAEIFNLRNDAKIWAYSETRKRNKNAMINGLQEILPLW